MCGYAYMNAGARGGQSSIKLDLQLVVSHWHGCWASNLGPLNEQCVLLGTESSLQPTSAP